jgi:hypothetical protein
MANRETRIAEFVERLRVEPGSRVVLAKRFDPASKAGIASKKKGGSSSRRASSSSASTRRGWLPRTPTVCWSSSRPSMRAARTG